MTPNLGRNPPPLLDRVAGRNPRPFPLCTSAKAPPSTLAEGRTGNVTQGAVPDVESCRVGLGFARSCYAAESPWESMSLPLAPVEGSRDGPGPVTLSRNTALDKGTFAGGALADRTPLVRVLR